jgi:glycosyltransferase involved in cell wall biosynthesis
VKFSILHVTAPAPQGGLESVVRALAAGQVRRGHSVRVAAVVSPHNGTHPFVNGLERDGVDAVPISVGARDYRAERRAIRDLCRSFRPDIVHTHGYRSDFVDGALARREGSGVVSTCHGFIERDLRGRFFQWLQRRALRKFDAVIAVSAAIQRRLQSSGIPMQRIHLIPNAFAPVEQISRQAARQILGVPDAPVIGWVGRLSTEKGPDLALRAFARLGRPEARLVMVGEGRQAEELRRLSESLGLGERVVWSGPIPDAGKLFSAFDAFLLSSRTEGTPMVLLEAMAGGIPIVATRVGGVPQVLDDSSAWLIESGDVGGLANALAEVLSEPGRARKRTQKALNRLQTEFSLEEWLARHDSLYRGIVRGPQPRD